MDERIDILDSKGNPTGKTAMKSKAHAKGLFHQTVHIWFYTGDGRILLQQRGAEKKTHPLLWDVSVAGHIAAGEEIEIAALREVEEEIGLTISVDELKKIGVFPSFFEHHENLIDNEFHHSFICKLQVPLANLKKQPSEVEALNLFPVDTFKMQLGSDKFLKKFVPHEIAYYHTIIQEIEKAIGIH